MPIWVGNSTTFWLRTMATSAHRWCFQDQQRAPAKASCRQASSESWLVEISHLPNPALKMKRSRHSARGIISMVCTWNSSSVLENISSVFDITQKIFFYNSLNMSNVQFELRGSWKQSKNMSLGFLHYVAFCSIMVHIGL